MEIFEYILKICYYFMFVWSAYKVAVCYQNKSNVKNLIDKRSKSIPILLIVILGCFFGYYSIICGTYPYTSDRADYAFKFQNDYYSKFVKSESIGLYWLESVLHAFTYEPKILFFVVAFLYLFLTFLAYNMCDNAKPFTILLLGVSSYYIFGFYMLKQCMAIALIGISFAAFTKNKRLTSIFSMVLAICFHETAWIVIPVLFLLYGSKYKILRIFEYVGLVVCLVFFRQINQIIVNMFITIIPSLQYQLSTYLNESGGLISNLNIMTALKGLPFYFITIFGYLERDVLKQKIKYYDQYMLLSFFVSMTIMLSSYMYWMFRFGIFFYFPVFMFASRILEELKQSRSKILFVVGTSILFFVLTLRLLSQYYFIHGGII